MKFAKLEIRHTHPHGFRSGQWASCVRVAVVTPHGLDPRPAYLVEYLDGVSDYIAFNDIDLEFRSSDGTPLDPATVTRKICN